jgi:hypothetical protein
MGIGYSGGEWRGGSFFYNTAIVKISFWHIHHTFFDHDRVERFTVLRDSHIAFSGGPNGIHHEFSPEERMYEREQHMNRTTYQVEHQSNAMRDHDAYFHNNSGHPHVMSTDKPLVREERDMHNMPAHQDAPRDMNNSNAPDPRFNNNNQRNNVPAQAPNNRQLPGARQTTPSQPAATPTRPSSPSNQPATSPTRPSSQPAATPARPSSPSNQPASTPNRPASTPSTAPSTAPQHPATPQKKPAPAASNTTKSPSKN